jgi:AcrR family transcriptional regulator
MKDSLDVTTTAPGAQDPAQPQASQPVLPSDLEDSKVRRRAARPGRRQSSEPKPVKDRDPPHRRAATNRRRVMDAATLLWAEHGVISDSIRLLAFKAGVAPATIYNLVGNREEMLAEIMTTHVIRLTEQVCAAADAASIAGPVERLEAMLAAFLSGISQDRCAHFLLRHGLAGLGPCTRDPVRLRYCRLLELLREPLALLAPSAQAEAMLALAVVGAAADAALWFGPQQEWDVPATARRLTAMLLAAVASAGGSGPCPGCGGPVETCAPA